MQMQKLQQMQYNACIAIERAIRDKTFKIFAKS